MGNAHDTLEVIRAFIAFELPGDILDSIGELQRQLKKRGLKLRWVPLKNIHLTIKFIGDLAGQQIDAVVNCMADSVQGGGPMTLHASSLGVFPGLRRPRVLWTGIDGEIDRLIQFQKRLDQKLDGIGIRTEARPFRGHLTIGRAKGHLNMEILRESLRAFYDVQTRPFIVKDLKLLKSELTPAGAVYTCLQSVALSEKAES